ncbi:uncharacterized protein LOC126907961 [Daktulosphaira vitifoliae]|uniref:uncharacterized protein LOC126907961 n=1 Tax=Daktulosphaira vitifoliae TaxID=58002 RepID=UPI0021AAAB83|nr:uncharacterized protein LOC126907961 [Daktulosphaira vitifoliae]XP_050545670.1 uncharacterized protein LOC126907961 [Daktulosphaira vitifoliae]
MATRQELACIQDSLFDTSTFAINILTHVRVGLDPLDLFWPKIELIEGCTTVNLTIHFLQRFYSMVGYFSLLSDNDIVLLEDEHTVVQKLNGVTQSYVFFMIQSKDCKEYQIMLSQEGLNRFYELKNIIFETLNRKLLIARPQVVFEIKMILKTLIMDASAQNKQYLCKPEKKTLPSMLFFHEINQTDYLSKCIDYASRVIFNNNRHKIKGNIFDIFSDLNLMRFYPGISYSEMETMHRDSLSNAKLRWNDLKNQWEIS